MQKKHEYTDFTESQQLTHDQLLQHVILLRKCHFDYLSKPESVTSQVLLSLENEILMAESAYSRALEGGLLAPSSNTGGISDYILVDLGGSVVKVPRPNTLKNPDCAFVDWINFTFKIDSFSKFLNCSFGGDLDLVVESVSSHLFRIFGFHVTSKRNSGINGYQESYVVGNEFGFVAIGGDSQAGTVFVSINGKGLSTASVHFEGWQSRLVQFGELIGAKITRLDLAHDCYSGEYTVDLALSDYLNDLFKMTRQPDIEQRGNWIKPNGKGRTLYVGSRGSGKLLRVYEKGLQLGSSDFKDWVRIELELHNKDRFIPWDAVINAGHYLAGSYPALSFISKVQDRVKTVKAVVCSTVEKVKKVIKNQFGKHLNLIHDLFGIDDIKRLFVDEFPRSLRHIDFSCDTTSMFVVRDGRDGRDGSGLSHLRSEGDKPLPS